MKFQLIFFLLASAMLISAEVVLERFDDPQATQGEIIPGSGAELIAGGGMERGALKAVGQKKTLQYFYRKNLSGKPGDKFAIALNYTANLPVGNGFLIIVLYRNDRNQVIGNSYLKLTPSFVRWTHRQFEITLPAGAVKAEVLLRLAGVPENGEVKVDFLRMAPIIDGKAKGIDLEEFETAFDGWQFDKHLIFDHFMPGRGGKVVNEWREAKIGEAFFQAEGSGEPMQYAFYIDNIKVKPRCNYVFEAWLKATENFKFKANGILIFFYKDKDNKPIGQSRYYISDTNNEWKELLHTFTTPEKCRFVDIGLNMRKMKSTDRIKLDHIRFKNAGDKLYVKKAVDSRNSKMVVTTALTGNLKSSDIVSGKFTVITKDKKPVRVITTPAAAVRLEVDLKTLKDGEYFVIPEMTLKDGRVITAPAEFFSVYNHPDWLNDIGIQKPEMTPPAPWKKLEANGRNSVKNWNGNIEFTGNGMIKNIYAGNDNILRSAMKITVNAAELSLTASPIKVQPSVAAAALSGKNGNLQFSGKVTTDYMGFTCYTIKVKALQDTMLDEFRITLPVKNADFISRTDGSWSNVGAASLDEIKEFTSKSFYDNVLIGTIDRGISFYLTKLEPANKRVFDRNWLVMNKKHLSANLVGEKFLLKAGSEKIFDFAICAFPYRPAENNWRKLRFRAGKNSNFDLVWQTSKMFKYAGSLAVAGDEKSMKNYLAKTKGYRMFYQIPNYILENIPQWSFFKDQWQAMPSRAYDMQSFGRLPKGNFRNRIWQDLYVKKLVEMLKKHPWDGVYYDCFGTDIFTENGEHSNPVFDLRKFHERIYNAQRLNDPGNITVVHAGADQGSTMCSYANVMLMGEQYRSEFYTNTYFNEFMSMDRFRYENASKIGPDRMLLPQYRQVEKIESPGVSTHLSGMATLHCLMIYPNFIHSATELSIRDRMYAFGLEDADFTGYWHKDKPQIISGNKDVYVSYFSKKSGAFVTVLNYSRKVNRVKLEIPFAYKKAVIFDPLTQKDTVFKGGVIELEPSMAKFITILK